MNYRLTCVHCGKESGDVLKDPHAWDGWGSYGDVLDWLCPECYEKAPPENGEGRNDEHERPC
jgi:hypothetical protein